MSESGAQLNGTVNSSVIMESGAGAKNSVSRSAQRVTDLMCTACIFVSYSALSDFFERIPIPEVLEVVCRCIKFDLPLFVLMFLQNRSNNFR